MRMRLNEVDPNPLDPNPKCEEWMIPAVVIDPCPYPMVIDIT